MEGERAEPQGLPASHSPSLGTALLSPARSPHSEAVTQAGRAVRSPPPLRFLLPFPPLPLASLPSFQSLPPSFPSLPPLVPTPAFSLLLLRSTAAGPTKLQTRSPALPPTSSPRPSPSIQARMLGAPDRGTHKTHGFLLILYPFLYPFLTFCSHTMGRRFAL